MRTRPTSSILFLIPDSGGYPGNTGRSGDIRESDLVPGGAGVRAQAVDTEGRLVDDFAIIQTEGAIHVCSAPSPGATASLMIGKKIADMAEEAYPALAGA